MIQLTDRVRTWPMVWRSRLVFYWLTREKDSLGFVLMLSVPLAILGSMVHLAYAHGVRLDSLRERHELVRQRDKDLQCLAENVYFEARGEPIAGQYAVAEVTLNRVGSPYFPNSICEVVYQKAAFSWTGLPRNRPYGEAWEQAMEVATAVYDRTQPRLLPQALFYHATYVEPDWARGKKSVARIGSHVFYR